MLEQHALAAARGAEQRDGLAVLDHEVDAVQHHLLAESLADAMEFNHGCRPRWLSAIGYQLSAIGYRPSALRYPPSAVGNYPAPLARFGPVEELGP